MDTPTALWLLFSLALIGLAYFAGLTFILGLLWRLYGYLRTPMPWPAATTPAPVSESRAVVRVLGDVAFFPNLFKADKFLWAGAWIFHAALFTVLLRHLRYFTYPVPDMIVALEQVALVTGYVLGLAILYLLWRRLVLPRPLYLSNLPDYTALLLLAAITATGILLKYWGHAYLVDVKAFTLGLLTLHPVAPPAHPLFLLHFLLVVGLLFYFPFSKLLHAGGIFFSPTRNQPYQVQQAGRRYVNPWDYLV